MWIDTHAHLDFPVFGRDLQEVLARARDAGVRACVVPSISSNTFERTRGVCASDPLLLPCFGLHPYFIDQHVSEDLQRLQDWVLVERPIAIGECGLDGMLDSGTWQHQMAMFEGQLAIAKRLNIPTVVHARKALEQVILAIRASGQRGGIVHSFSGSLQQAHRLIDLGYLIGIGGTVTFERAKRLKRVLAALPLDSLVLETDAPDQPDAGIRGQRNEPARVAVIGAVLADLRNMPIAQIASSTTANAQRLLGSTLGLC